MHQNNILNYLAVDSQGVINKFQYSNISVIPHLMRNPGFYSFWIPASAGTTLQDKDKIRG
jgi:hypothetical protein